MPAAPQLELVRAIEELRRAHRETGAWFAGETSCSRAHLSVVRLLDLSGPLLVGDLAAQLRIDISVASRQVTGLVDAGMVERTAVDGDRRARAVGLTPAGRELASRARVAVGELIGEILADWTDAEIDDTAAHFRRLTIALGAHHDRCAAARLAAPEPSPAPAPLVLTPEPTHDDREHA